MVSDFEKRIRSSRQRELEKQTTQRADKVLGSKKNKSFKKKSVGLSFEPAKSKGNPFRSRTGGIKAFMQGRI